MDLIELLKQVELFEGLSDDELKSVASLCKERTFHSGEVITQQGQPGREMYVITEGWVEVVSSGQPGQAAPRAVVNLGMGQLVGEMTLVDAGPRSATVRALSDPTLVQVIDGDNFSRLCERDYRLGFTVMRNMAADLSFKLRHRNLAGR